MYACNYVYIMAWLSSAPGVLSTVMTSVVLYSLTRATLMSPGQDEKNNIFSVFQVSIFFTGIWKLNLKFLYC